MKEGGEIPKFRTTFVNPKVAREREAEARRAAELRKIQESAPLNPLKGLSSPSASLDKREDMVRKNPLVKETMPAEKPLVLNFQEESKLKSSKELVLVRQEAVVTEYKVDSAIKLTGDFADYAGIVSKIGYGKRQNTLAITIRNISMLPPDPAREEANRRLREESQKRNSIE